MTRPMRIAVFVYEFPALSETFVLNQVTGLIDRGHDVTVFAERPRDEHVVHGVVKDYDLERRTVYLDMPGNKLARVLLAPGRFLRCPPRRFKPLLRALDLFRYRRDAASLRLFYWSLRTLASGRFDVIHCHFGPVGRLAAQLREIGAIEGSLSTVFHGVDVSAALRDDPCLYRDLFAKGDLFLPVSEEWRRKLISLGCDPGRTIVHHMGVETDAIPTARDREAGHAAIPAILTVGRMVEKKGVEFGLRAVAELVRRKAVVQYAIVGDGALRPRLEALARELGIWHLVTFYGWQPRETVQDLLRTSDILLAPSTTDRLGDQEGIPVTLMEAMAAGVPVVSTRHSGIPELVEDGVSGLLAAERDWEAMADAMQRLLEDRAASSALAKAAQRRVVRDFDIEVLNTLLEKRFVELVRSTPNRLSGPPRRRPAGRPHRSSGAHA